jgi:hypothetical protein
MKSRRMRRVRVPTVTEFNAAFEQAIAVPPQQHPDECNPLTDEELFMSTPDPDPAKFAILWDLVGEKEAIKNYSHLEHCAFVGRYVRPSEVKTWPEAARLAINRHLEQEELKR